MICGRRTCWMMTRSYSIGWCSSILRWTRKVVILSWSNRKIQEMIQRNLSSSICRTIHCLFPRGISPRHLRVKERNTVSIRGSAINASSVKRPFFSDLRWVCTRFPWLPRGSPFVLAGGREGVLLGILWEAGVDEGVGAWVNVFINDDCLFETVGEGWDPPVPGVKGFTLGLEAIREGVALDWEWRLDSMTPLTFGVSKRNLTRRDYLLRGSFNNMEGGIRT